MFQSNNRDDFWFSASDGHELFVSVWSDVLAPKGIIQIIHGMAEHGKRYEEFAKFLNSKGYIVFADDHRGHGKTAKTIDALGYIGEDGFERIVQDEYELTEHFKKQYNLPLIIVSHSFGSFVAQRYCILHSEAIEGITYIGTTAGRSTLSYVLAKVARAQIFVSRKGEAQKSNLLNFLASGSFNKRTEKVTNVDWLAKNSKTVTDYINDPYCGTVFTAGFYYHLSKGLSKMYNKKVLSNIRKDLPILILGGEEDPVGGYGKFFIKLKEYYQRVGIQNVSCTIYKDMRHEILNEEDNIRVYKKISSFIESCIS